MSECWRFNAISTARAIFMAKQCMYRFKDRVGRSGCDLLWVYLNHNIFLNLQGTKTYDMSKNSPFSYLFTNIRYSFEFTRPVIGSGH